MVTSLLNINKKTKKNTVLFFQMFNQWPNYGTAPIQKELQELSYKFRRTIRKYENITKKLKVVLKYLVAVGDSRPKVGRKGD